MSTDDKKITIADMASSFVREFGFSKINGIEKRTMLFWRGDFYIWRSGCYSVLSKDEMRTLMVKHVSSLGQPATTGLMDNLKLNIMAGVLIGKDRIPDTWLSDLKNADVATNDIVLENGIISIVGNEVKNKELTPDFFCLGKLPYKYDPSAECPRWMRFLDEVTRKDKEIERMLQQWAGYLIMPSQKYQSFLLLIGEAGTGKGTYARAMKALLGSKNCSDVPLRRFTDKFSLYLTYGKKLNVAGDAEQELTPQSEAIIKTWTGEDGLDFEKKYGEGFTANPTAKLMILCNDFPNFTDKSMGTWRRLKVVPFHRDDPTVVEKGLDETLRGELPGILNWAIKGLMDLEENEGFVVPEVGTRLREMYQTESNPARMFLRENYEYDPAYSYGVSRSELYRAYRKWCDVKGYQKMSDKTFGKEIRREFPNVEERRLGGHTSNTRFRVHQGLKLQRGAEIGAILSAK